MFAKKIVLTSVAAALLSGAAIAQQPPAPQPPAPQAGTPPAAAPAKPAPSGPAAAQPSKSPVDGWAGEVAPVKSTEGLTLDENQSKVVKTVSDYFSALNDMQGNFVQIGADNKRMRGKFFVKRPGRFRFDYSRPSRQIIISDGVNMAIQDLDLNNEDRLKLDDTPFRMLLRKDVDLLRDAKIFEVQQSEDQIVLGLQDKSPDTPGRIRLYLATKPALELKEWVTTDAQGLDTRVEVTALVKGEDIDAKIFKIQQLGAHRTSPN